MHRVWCACIEYLSGITSRVYPPGHQKWFDSGLRVMLVCRCHRSTGFSPRELKAAELYHLPVEDIDLTVKTSEEENAVEIFVNAGGIYTRLVPSSCRTNIQNHFFFLTGSCHPHSALLITLCTFYTTLTECITPSDTCFGDPTVFTAGMSDLHRRIRHSICACILDNPSPNHGNSRQTKITVRNSRATLARPEAQLI